MTWLSGTKTTERKSEIFLYEGGNEIIQNPRILIAIDGSERSFAASDDAGKVFSKQAEIVLFHVMSEAPEALRDVSEDPLTKKENYPLRVWKADQEEAIQELMTMVCDILIASGFPKNSAICLSTHSVDC